MNDYSKNFLENINKASSIAICTHINPDGDAIGSSLGLYYVLKDMKKDVFLIKNDTFPTNLTFLPDTDLYVESDREVDLLIVLDVAGIERIGAAGKFIDKSKFSICIDHHQTNEGFCDENIIIPSISSTCELVVSMLEKQKVYISPKASTYFYLGMVTDTNGFQYESVTSNTMRTAGYLMDCGADKSLIINNLYEKLDMNYHLLQAKIMQESKFLANKKIVISKLTQNDLEKYNLDFDKVDSLVSIMKSIDGVELSVLIKEYGKNEQKISMRSKKYINVSKIAQEYGGGGHIRAAGCTIFSSLDDAYKIILNRMEKLIDEGDIADK